MVGKTENHLVFKIVTPRKTIIARDIGDVEIKMKKMRGEIRANHDRVIVDVIDFSTGKRVGRFKPNIAKLKFG